VWSPGLPIIVVGAVGYVPDIVQYQSSPNFPSAGVDVWAPGKDIVCDGTTSGKSGTSQGKSTISGLSNIC
jgi:hypothetical protein